jgi:hypothetical protein
MTTQSYNYEFIIQHPKLLAFYSGWLGQKICYLTHAAVIGNQPDLWFAAAAEVDRLVLALHYAVRAGRFKLPREMRAALGELVGHYADGGWWMSDDGRLERVSHDRERQDSDDSCDALFRPRLLLEHDPEYLVAATLLKRLGVVLMQTAGLMKSVDVCRMGVLLSGFCYRLTPRLDAWFVSSVFNDLAAYGMTDSQAVNEFRRAMCLREVCEDRRLQLRIGPVRARPFPPDDGQASRGGSNSFATCDVDMTDYRDLVLGCVFRRFGVTIPPAECDASQYPKLADLKKQLRTASIKAKRTRGQTELSEETRFWTEEAIAYLGLDRCGLASPALALQRLIKKGVLRPIKIGRRNSFTKAELDHILSKGGQARRRGRPRKDGK